MRASIRSILLILPVWLAVPPSPAQVAYPGGVYTFVPQPAFPPTSQTLALAGYQVTALDIQGPLHHIIGDEDYPGFTSAIYRSVIPSPIVHYHGIRHLAYLQAYALRTSQGYRPKELVNTGRGREARNRYAALFVKDGLAGYAQPRQSLLEYFAEAAGARRRGYWPESITVYDVLVPVFPFPVLRRYGTVWVENPHHRDWVVIREATPLSLQPIIDSYRAQGFCAYYVAASKDPPYTYSVIMRKGLGYLWDITFDTPAADVENVVRARVAAGWAPKHVSYGGSAAIALWVRHPIFPPVIPL